MTGKEAYDEWFAGNCSYPGTADPWEAWKASRQQAIEECALICDGQLDGAKEAESLMKFNFARNTGASEEEQVRAGEFWNDVHTLNAVLLRAAKAIRSLGEAS